MALTNAEKQRRYRKRQQARKAAELITQEAPAYPIAYRRAFHEWLEKHADYSEIEMAFDVVGLVPPEFHDDSGAKSGTGFIEDPDGTIYRRNNSLGKAELFVGIMLESATIMARYLNRYKLEEIDALMAELKTRDLSNEQDKEAVLAEHLHLTRAREQLEKDTRWTLRQWKVKDE